jgi:hypothetical protein
MDVTDYRAFGLSPGVKATGKSKLTSSGVMADHRTGGMKRLTLAEHGFDDTDEVYHPDLLPQLHLGTIETRFPLINAALCRLDANVNYSNQIYFSACPPKRIVSTLHIDEHMSTASWFEAEGMTTGHVSLLYSGPAVGYPDLPAYVGEARILKEYVFDYFGPNPSGAKSGLCGAPVVHEPSLNDNLDGILIGLVWWNSDRDCCCIG